MKTKKKFINQTLKNTIYILFGVIAFLLIWQVTSLIINEPLVFPTFTASVVNAIEILGTAQIYKSIGISLGISFLAILLSFILALIFGIISGLFNWFEKFFTPFVSFFKIVPTACIIIILIIFTKSIVSYITIVFLIVFPILYENILKGIKSLSEEIVFSVRLEGIYKINSIKNVLLPMVSPYIGAGLASSIGIGIKVEIMSEIIVGSTALKGFGYLIYNVRAVTFNYIDIYSYILIILVVFLLIQLLLYFIKKLFIKIY